MNKRDTGGKKWFLQVVMVSLLTSLVILANVIIGWTVIATWFSFYLAVFFFLFVPVWLVAFGLVFQPAWKWHSMFCGSFLAAFVLCFAFFATSEDLAFRFGNSLVLAILGSIFVVSGWLLRKLARDIRQERTDKKKKRSSNEHPTSLGM